MTEAWTIAIGESARKLFLVQEQAYEHGVTVCVPKQYQWKRFELHCAPRIAPYFFVMFNLDNTQERAFVKSLRGVSDVLKLSRPIPDADILLFQEWEIIEQRGSFWKVAKQCRGDLVVDATYVVLTHQTWAGKSGKLSYSMRGRAKLIAPNGIVMDVDENDIAMVEKAAA